MANFKPLKKYLIELISIMIEKNGAKEPFLDIGCGRGDISLFLAKKGWSGKAIDISEFAFKTTKEKLKNYPKVKVNQIDFSLVQEKFNTLIACDIIEHIPDDKSFIKKVKQLLNDSGHLIISLPIIKNEWRWDDEFYGHLRRYEIPEIIELLHNNNFKTLDIWDFTFPIFWLIRRIYTKLIPNRVVLSDNKRRTLLSSSQNAWDYGILTTLVEKLVWWKPIFWIQKKFKHRLIGCECLIIAELNHSERK